jgi:hypothetical protein
LIARRPLGNKLLHPAYTLLRFRGEIGQVLALIACTITVTYFEYVFGWGWYASIPVGVLAFISMLTVWWKFIGDLESQRPSS